MGLEKDTTGTADSPTDFSLFRSRGMLGSDQDATCLRRFFLISDRRAFFTSKVMCSCERHPFPEGYRWVFLYVSFDSLQLFNHCALKSLT